MRLIQAMLAACAALLLGLAPAAAQTYPKLTGRVVDAANVLPPATEVDLSAKLQALERDTKRQLIVATIPDLQGRELVEYGVGLGRAWGIGLKDVDNGAILFIAPNEPAGHRGPRLEVGRGLEPVLTDAFAGTMIRNDMLPKLKQSGDIPGAMEAGTDAIIAQLRASPEEQKARVDAAAAEFDRAHRTSRSGGGGFPVGIIVFGFIALFVLLSFGRRAGGQRYAGRSGGDGGLMPVILWGIANEIGNQATRGSWGGGSSGWSGGGSSGGGSDSGWGGSDFSGGGGGDFGGGGASGDW